MGSNMLLCTLLVKYDDLLWPSGIVYLTKIVKHAAGWLRSTPLSTQRTWTASSHISPRENVASPSPIRLGNAESSRLGGAVRRRATRLCVGSGTRSGSHDQVEPPRRGLRSEFRWAPPRRGWLEPS